jgi:hypothetical protein
MFVERTMNGKAALIAATATKVIAIKNANLPRDI